MVTAIVLIDTGRDKADIMAGTFAGLVTNRMLRIDGSTAPETRPAFPACPRHDPARMFPAGMAG